MQAVNDCLQAIKTKNAENQMKQVLLDFPHPFDTPMM